MSILFKSPNGSGGSLGSNKNGFSCNNVNILNYIVTNSGVEMYYQDPDNTILNDSTLAKWNKTVIVRKENELPKNIKDGVVILECTEKNKYKDKPFIDTTVVKGTNYYYRFFAVSESNEINNEINAIYVIVKLVHEILSENSWDVINKVAEQNRAQEFWNIGDEIKVNLSGVYNYTCTLQIFDFNHFDKADGSGKAGIVFGFKSILENGYGPTGGYNGWDTNNIRNTKMKDVLNSLPIEVRSIVKEVITKTNRIYSREIIESIDQVFIPNDVEVGGSYIGSSEGSKFPIFTNDDSRNRGTTNMAGLWLRTSEKEYSSNGAYGYVNRDGKISLISYENYACFLPIFCI